MENNWEYFKGTIDTYFKMKKQGYDFYWVDDEGETHGIYDMRENEDSKDYQDEDGVWRRLPRQAKLQWYMICNKDWVMNFRDIKDKL